MAALIARSAAREGPQGFSFPLILITESGLAMLLWPSALFMKFKGGENGVPGTPWMDPAATTAELPRRKFRLLILDFKV